MMLLEYHKLLIPFCLKRYPNKKKTLPGGFEPPTYRLTAWRSTD